MTRLDTIRLNAEKWICGKLQLTQEDLMPDIIYLLEMIDQLLQQSSRNT